MRYENSFKNITAFVISFHALCIGWCVWSGTTPPVKKIHEKLIVKTVSTKSSAVAKTSNVSKQPEPVAMAEPVAAPPEPEPEPKPYVEPEPEPYVEPKPVAKPKAKSEPKKETKPKEKEKPKKEEKPVTKVAPKKVAKEEKKVAAKPKPKPQPQVSKEDLRKQELIAKAQSLLSKTGSNTSKKSSSDNKLVNLGTIGKLEIDNAGTVSDVERRYQDILASHLKDRLCFPDYGEVKIKLTLERSGKVLKVEVISSKSDENRSYAVKVLPGILFPSFHTFIKEDKYTFSVTLKND